MEENNKVPVNQKKKVRKEKCGLCYKVKTMPSLLSVDIIPNSIISAIKSEYPEWEGKGYVCLADLKRIKGHYVEKILEEELGKLTTLERQVVRSLKKHEILSENINQEFDRELTFGEKVSDRVASFGGSWKFIISFALIIFVWILINTLLLLKKPFDPYPFILLNLVLSTLAAIQAPIIMMSQNRQEDRDRLRSEQDYKVNLKAELEIKHLNEKMDHLLTYQWQRLLEIQQLQIDLMEGIGKRKKN
ncbi:DUF1003 domain-containing protein [Patescibacteria group bacterium]|nr:DUF1003 domain-containing protein [Patescibacteria group bacterium]MBU1685313.1 DUF1003 domain-containing protein [Patescibacteria group bacterium]MBU1938947.1 DUF1003 domain-containing protein [Patescibacteria group bacterium]